jgi:hypothetical protein
MSDHQSSVVSSGYFSSIYIQHRQLQMSNRSLMPMLDPPQHSRQILNNRLRAFTGVFNYQLCRRYRVSKIGPSEIRIPWAVDAGLGVAW